MKKTKQKKPRKFLLKGIHKNLHPELKKGEVLLANGNNESYNKIKWKTKRKGNVAYSILHLHRGVHFIIRSLFPIFLQKYEIEEYNNK